jgi:hypothetical protein
MTNNYKNQNYYSNMVVSAGSYGLITYPKSGLKFSKRHLIEDLEQRKCTNADAACVNALIKKRKNISESQYMSVPYLKRECLIIGTPEGMVLRLINR